MVHRRRWIVALSCFLLAVVACDGKKRARDDAPTAPPPRHGEPPLSAGFDANAHKMVKPPPPAVVVAAGHGDCAPAYAPAPGRDPSPMCKVTGGRFTMGTDDPEAGLGNESPAHAVIVSDFYIDQLEVTIAQVAYYLDAVGTDLACPELGPDTPCMRVEPSHASPSPIRLEDGHHVFDAAVATHPFRFATLAGARNYCTWADKRLPTEAEWAYAARHDPASGTDRVYPWGDSFEPDRVRCEGPTCRDAQGQGFTPVGTFDGRDGRGDGASPWGALDMAGNAIEWMADCDHGYEACEGACADPRHLPTSGECEYGVTRGASYDADLDANDGPMRAAFRSPTLASAMRGFRCAR